MESQFYVVSSPTSQTIHHGFWGVVFNIRGKGLLYTMLWDFIYLHLSWDWLSVSFANRSVKRVKIREALCGILGILTGGVGDSVWFRLQPGLDQYNKFSVH